MGAKSLWEKVTEKYNPIVHHINDEETVLEFPIVNRTISGRANDVALMYTKNRAADIQCLEKCRVNAFYADNIVRAHQNQEVLF